jgi:hypothetical protein
VYSVWCTVYSVWCMVYCPAGTGETVTQCTIRTMYYVLCTQCTIRTMYTMYTMHNTNYVHYTLYTIHYTLYTIHYTLTHYTLIHSYTHTLIHSHTIDHALIPSYAHTPHHTCMQVRHALHRALHGHTSIQPCRIRKECSDAVLQQHRRCSVWCSV